MPLASISRALTDRAIRQKGFVQTEVVAKWSHIVGKELAAHSLPVKLTFRRGSRMEGTMAIRCESAYAPIIQHQQDRVIEMVNSFFGYKAVGQLAVQQGPLKHQMRSKPHAARPLSNAEKRHLDQVLSKSATDSDLKAALRRLGEQVLGASKDKLS